MEQEFQCDKLIFWSMVLRPARSENLTKMKMIYTFIIIIFVCRFFVNMFALYIYKQILYIKIDC